MTFKDLKAGEYFRTGGNDSVYLKDEDGNISVEILGPEDEVDGVPLGKLDYTLCDSQLVYPVEVKITKTYEDKPVILGEISDGSKFKLLGSEVVRMKIREKLCGGESYAVSVDGIEVYSFKNSVQVIFVG